MSVARVRKINNPYKRPGIAIMRRIIVPKTGWPAELSQNPLAMMTDSVAIMAIQVQILKADTDPSAKPVKKKTTTMAHIRASIVKKIQKNLSPKIVTPYCLVTIHRIKRIATIKPIPICS